LLAQILQESKTLGSDIPRAKSQDAKFLEFFWLLTSRLCVFAGDIPIFGCGSAALGASW
jgi:hypothetical protein